MFCLGAVDIVVPPANDRETMLMTMVVNGCTKLG
jgi:hypothetical protein